MSKRKYVTEKEKAEQYDKIIRQHAEHKRKKRKDAKIAEKVRVIAEFKKKYGL